jgi:hypothetical protein
MAGADRDGIAAGKAAVAACIHDLAGKLVAEDRRVADTGRLPPAKDPDIGAADRRRADADQEVAGGEGRVGDRLELQFIRRLEQACFHFILHGYEHMFYKKRKYASLRGVFAASMPRTRRPAFSFPSLSMVERQTIYDEDSESCECSWLRSWESC